MRAFVNDERFSDVKFTIAEGYEGEGKVIHGHLCILISQFHGIFEVSYYNIIGLFVTYLPRK